MSTTRRIALVLNERAGRLLAGDTDADALRALLRADGVVVEEPAEGPLPERFAAAAASGAAAVVVAGGDGTVACACQALAGGSVALAIIPLGTMNLLARDLGMPVDDVAAAAVAVHAGVERAIDVGEVGPHVFACACMLGAPARIGHHREAARARGNGVLAWAAVARAAVRTLWRGRRLDVRLLVDGVETRLRTRALTITANAVDVADDRPFGRSRLDGGQLFAYAEQVRGTVDALRLGAKLMRGSAHDPAMRVLHGARIELHTRSGAALRLLIDGEERLLTPPLLFCVRQGGLRVVAARPIAEGP